MARITHYKKEWLKDIVIINTALPKVELTVASTVNEKNYIPPSAPDKSGKWIVTLKAIAIDNVARLKELFKHRDEVPIEEMNGLFMTGNIWEVEGMEKELPSRGEKVLCSVGLVQLKKEDRKALRITGEPKLQKAVKLDSINMDTFFTEEDELVLNEATEATVAASHADEVEQ